MVSTLDLSTFDLIVASQNLRARSRELGLRVAETRSRAQEAIARARRTQLTISNKTGVRARPERTAHSQRISENVL